MKLKLKKYKQEGDLAWQYQPFHNMVTEKNEITDFDTNELGIDMSNPLSIECQPSYDGTVNLIINDDKNPPRIINSRFTKIEDNRYRVITRNQKEQTNLYKVGKIDSQTRLFRNLNHIPQMDLRGVSTYGQLMGGLYTFYVKFADNDYNKTDIVCESGQIPIFKGTISNPSTISGTIVDERTDKSIRLRISNIDTSFQKIYLYFTRETCDTNGIKVIKAGELVKPYDIENDYIDITINGFEEINDIDVEQLNIQYNLASTVKTQAQVQNMLFFGNITDPKCNNTLLQNLSYFIKVSVEQGDSIGDISDSYKNTGSSISKTEYYNPQNVYYKLGYWPDEIYRIGVVYILNDDSLSPVYNLRGCIFNELHNYNYDENSEYGQMYEDPEAEYKNLKYLPKQEFLYDDTLENTIGVFKTPKKNINIYTDDGVKPLFFKMEISEDILNELQKQNIKGYFFVRQKRIPTILGEGLTVGINKNCYIPMLYDTTKIASGTDENGNPIMKDYGYFAESFLSNAEQKLVSNLSARTLKYYDPSNGNFNNIIQSSALLSLDAAVTPLLQSNYDGSEFVLEKMASKEMEATGRRYSYIKNTENPENIVTSISTQIVYVDENVPLRMMDSYGFCTRAGEAEDVSQLTFFNEASKDELENAKPKLVRGIYCPLLGTNTKLDPASIYRIKVHNYSEAFLKEYFLTRGNDRSSFFAISDRFELNSENNEFNIYRGDCYTNTVTMRLNRNFIDPDVPIDDTIIDEDTWRDNFLGLIHVDNDKPLEKLGKVIKNTFDTKILGKKEETEYTDFTKINRADVNAVPLGVWVTFKCLSNYNLGIRALDERYFEEHAKMGNARTFYPVSDISTKSSYKVPESFLLNEGYSITHGERRNFIYEDVPYIKDQFDNRIMFSNVQEEDAFRNAYRIFQGLSYQDIDRQYGSIVKLLPWKENLLCVFEHGIGIVPVNQKALMSTTTGQSIHLYGAGVLQSQISVISPDFGSIWQESIIRTPIGVYGVDTTAKKIWRFSEQKGFEIISDFKIQRFLNDHITLREKDKYPTISLLNVKTHFNNFKGDVMFTFYNNEEDETWNLCFNERIDKWVTRYSWTPLYSENINNIFCSFDRERTKVFAHIYDNKNCTYGLRTDNQQWIGETYTTRISLQGYSLSDSFNVKIKSAKYSYLDIDNVEQFVDLDLTKITISETESSAVKELSVNVGQEAHKVYYLIIQLDITPIVNGAESEFILKETIGAVRQITNNEKEEFKKLLGNGVYIHGRAGIFDEINYLNEKLTDQCMPTYWYDKQEPFEFEFVVNGDIGLHKIFNDLVIISNNVQPNSLEFEVTGDAYNFNKAGLYWEDKKEKWDETDSHPNREWNTKYNKVVDNKYQLSQELDPNRTEIIWDNIQNTYSLKVHQDCRNIKEYGRIKGNIYYKEDSFYTNIEPIVFKNKVKFVDSDQVVIGRAQSTRIRDKFCKIRVKYTGEDIVIITALKTMLQITYA